MICIIITYCGDVSLESFTGDGHKIFGQVDANLSFSIFLFIDAVVRLVVSATVGPDKVAELVLGSPPVRPTV